MQQCAGSVTSARPFGTIGGVATPSATSEVDRFLDAFARVVERHGLSRARVQDVADEAGVSRVTVYRQAGTVREMTQLLLERELHRTLPDAAGWAVDDDPIRSLVDLLARMVQAARSHPVLAKILRDEPQLLGPYLVRDLPEVLARSAEVGSALFLRAMERGRLADRDPARLGDWVARVLVTAVLAPPKGSLRDFFDAGLRPLWEPPRRG
jgi:AcrR family transcriptional regulator